MKNTETFFDGMDDRHPPYDNESEYPIMITEKIIERENEIMQELGLLFEENEPEDAEIGYELGHKARMEYVEKNSISIICPKCNTIPEYRIRPDGIWNEISCNCGFVWDEQKGCI